MTFAVIAVVDERIECCGETICIVDIDESNSVSSNLTDRANVACDDGEAGVLSLEDGEPEALVERGVCHRSSMCKQPCLGICVDRAEHMNPLFVAEWEAFDGVAKMGRVITSCPGDDE
jgi:hypothetical protein